MRYGAYIYVDGYDLHEVAPLLKRRLAEIAGRVSGVRVIDDRFERTPDLQPEDLPVWNLGLNFDLGAERAGLIRGVIESIRALSEESGRDFAVGYYDRVLKMDEDIGFIESGTGGDNAVGILLGLALNGEPGGPANAAPPHR